MSDKNFYLCKCIRCQIFYHSFPVNSHFWVQKNCCKMFDVLQQFVSKIFSFGQNNPLQSVAKNVDMVNEFSIKNRIFFQRVRETSLLKMLPFSEGEKWHFAYVSVHRQCWLFNLTGTPEGCALCHKNGFCSFYTLKWCTADLYYMLQYKSNVVGTAAGKDTVLKGKEVWKEVLESVQKNTAGVVCSAGVRDGSIKCGNGKKCGTIL